MMGPPIRIVVADDHSLVRENLRQFLNAEPGMTVVAAAVDGGEAVRHVRQHRPDILVLDHDMPVLDGIAVLSRVCVEPHAPAVVLYTSDERHCAPAIAAGAAACVVKDEAPRDLVAAIRRAAAERQTRPATPLAASNPHDDTTVDASALSRAIDAETLQVVLQPLVEMRAARLTRLEALCRWSPAGRMIAPERFIALAEENALITPLTLVVLRQAGRALVELRRTQSDVRVNLNVSPASLRDPGFAHSLEAALRSIDLGPESLGIEITESVIMHDPTQTTTALQQLRGLGVRIEIDDFGTGYSSLARLVDLPIDGLKIDRRFVLTMTRDHRSEAIVRASIALAHDLGLEVVAEGVEDRETWDLLAAHGCDTAQGYAIAKPTPAAEIVQWLRGWPERSTALLRVNRVRPKRADRYVREVLVVDDEPAILQIARDVLEDAGFHVATAANGAEALRLLEHWRPAVVLLDMQMPIVDGGAFTRTMRERGMDVPIVVMTAGSSAVRWAKELGVAGYLSKPFEIDALVDVTSRYALRN